MLSEEQKRELIIFAKEHLIEIAEASTDDDETLEQHANRVTEQDWLADKTQTLVIAMLEKIDGIKEIDDGVFAAEKELVEEMMKIIQISTTQMIKERLWQLEWM